jgi:transcriptional regulator with XRE-family HTH domain
MTPDELRQLREGMGMSQEALAKELGVWANTVARWERGERAMSHVAYLALLKIRDDRELEDEGD